MNIFKKAIFKGKILRRRYCNIGACRVLQVTDSGNWALKWVEYYIRININNKYGSVVKKADDSYGFRKELIHFIDRYAFLKGQKQHIDKSNSVALTWLHSNHKNEPNPDLDFLENVLVDSQTDIKYLITSNKIEKNHLEEIGIDKGKIFLIPLGVDTQHFCRVGTNDRTGLGLT